MAISIPRDAAPDPESDSGERAAAIAGRLGLNLPRDWWPTAPALKGLEAAGFAWLQVHAPPCSVLRDPVSAGRHAAALRHVLDVTGLRLVLHAPDDLRAGTPADDAALDGLLEYAAAVGGELIVLHVLDLPLTGAEERAEAEEESLRRAAPRACAIGTTLALENLAPVYPGPPKLGHDPVVVRDLVARLDSPCVGMTCDVGHAHITGELAGEDLVERVSAVRDVVALYHLHDNLGARRSPDGPPGIVPERLDLHLPPGQGSLPWTRIAPELRGRDVPLLLELHPPHRPEPLSVAVVSTELLTRADAPRPAPA